jgi:hypothetical protein
MKEIQPREVEGPRASLARETVAQVETTVDNCSRKEVGSQGVPAPFKGYCPKSKDFSRDEVMRDDEVLETLLRKYCVNKKEGSNLFGPSYLKMREYGLIHIADLKDAIWDEAEIRNKKAGKN